MKITERGFMRSLHAMVSSKLNYYLPLGVVGWLGSRGVLSRFARGIMIEKEMVILPRLVRSGDFVIDVGANIGDYTIMLSKLVGETGKVVAFEPLKTNFSKLSSLVNMGHLRNVVLRSVALGEEQGVAEIKVPYDKWQRLPNSAHVVFTKGQQTSERRESYPIQVSKLDEEIEPLISKDCRIAFIKCDAEGLELPILRGAKRILESFTPSLLLEVSDLSSRYGYSQQDLLGFLRRFGYIALWFDPTFGFLKRITDLEVIEKRHCNCLFVVNDKVQEIMGNT